MAGTIQVSAILCSPTTNLIVIIIIITTTTNIAPNIFGCLTVFASLYRIALVLLF
ncbi:MAG: hypothetical protein ACI976_001634 [Aureispira sp.]|jgi:hypothetical protein